MPEAPLYQLAEKIKHWGQALGFADVGITDTDLSAYEADYFNWLGEHYHGDMEYMARHGTKRTRPAELEPGTVSVISVRLNYFDPDAHSPVEQLQANGQAYVSRYALHKDYHKLMRKRLQQLAAKIEAELVEKAESFHYRAFVDSAPVLERPLAEKAGLGFIGKNSLIIHPRAGSWFFLGELYTNLPLPSDPPFDKQGCGPCTACIDECPTQAIVDNAVVDARRCISYLTIEYKGVIAPELREKMGNRIYGCDDCQLVCPWNKFTEATEETAFKPKHALDSASLLELLDWNEAEFLKHFEGSPIRRIGFEQWQRNLCVALGNALEDSDLSRRIVQTLETLSTDSELVLEHRDWALQRQKDALSLSGKTARPLYPLGGGRFSKPLKPAVAKKYYLPK
ncbi:tRNA epoxyqueuosine(34) reductase QueG [Thiomicrospira sp. S5]|uniref:tRNA epoxyqueuosine(34) reductase QueG n=1 Tax=Thiomicrospira sp. S5 TaxID=1803865 RepID=UPI000F8A0447|nr:tRNA epoxyqueuosine(34) reductase QueG [Thiomicrospira sp. S5]AZR82213.1 epoxyqueuosine reductase [Thiomicrospira sp. S5]